MSMQENIHVCDVLNRVHFLNKYSQIYGKKRVRRIAVAYRL